MRPTTRPGEVPWHQEPLVAFVALFFCWPAGLVLTWQNHRLEYSTKVLFTLVWFVALAAAGYYRLVFAGDDVAAPARH